jgi:hypothetical protein
LPASTIYPGVFGVTGTMGQVRVSALRQYGLLKGDMKDGFEATQAAKDIAAAPPEDWPALYKVAALSPKVFKSLYDVFQGDTTTFAKVRQQSAQLKVHIDTADLCAQTFIETLKFAGLATQEGDGIAIAGLDAVPRLPVQADTDEDEEVEEGDDDGAEEQQDESAGAGSNGQNAAPAATPPPPPPPPAEVLPAAAGTASARSVIHINFNLDSSFDTDKLEKQLALLRRYGAL